jgi:hypothetical protein
MTQNNSNGKALSSSRQQANRLLPPQPHSSKSSNKSVSKMNMSSNNGFRDEASTTNEKKLHTNTSHTKLFSNHNSASNSFFANDLKDTRSDSESDGNDLLIEQLEQIVEKKENRIKELTK